MFFEEHLSNEQRLSERIRKELGVVLHSSEGDLLEMGVEKLQEKLEAAKRIEEEVASAKLMGDDRQRLLSEVRLAKSKLSSALKLWREIRVVAELEAGGPARVGQPFTVKLVLRNKNPFDVKVSLEGSWSSELKLVSPFQKSLTVRARSSSTVSFLLQSSSEGAFLVGPFTVACKADGMEERITVEPLKVEVRSLKPIVKVAKSLSKAKASEGEEVEVTLTLKNEGMGCARSVHLKDDVSGLKVVGGASEWRGELPPGSSQSVSYRFVAERSLVLKPATVSFVDETGRQSTAQSNTVSIEVQAAEKRVEAGERKEEEMKRGVKVEAPPPVSVDEIVNEILKLGTLALIGYSLGSIVPKRRKVAKEVLVEGGLRWTAWKQGDQEVTLVFEHPIAVVREEHESFVRLRKATPVEIFHSVDCTTARMLQEQFIHAMRGVLSSWRPQGATEAEVKEFEDSEAFDKLRKTLKEYGEEIDERKLDALPRNPTLVCTYRAKRGVFRSETLLEVHVKTYANIEKLYFDGVDHAQMSLSHPEVGSFIKKLSQRKHPVIVFLCSPTGWDEETKRFAKEASDPKTHLVFVDLKTLDTYFNDSKSVLRELCSLTPKVEAAYPREAGEQLEKLDNLLLNGTLTLDRYIEEVKKLQLRTVAKEA
jgi:hypothetical protein